jgi:hypothetical protein
MRQKIEYKKGDVIGTCKFIKEINPIVFEITKTNKNKTIKRCATFQCNCGKEFNCIILAVKNGNTKSCGCNRDTKIQQQGFKNKDHGQRKHRLYKTWQGMLRRCNSPNDFGYYNYGGRGIKVCDRWKNINNFLLDMYPTYKEGLELDRINVNGNYELDNCRWITRKQNMNNTRKSRYIEYNGITKTVSEWSDELNIPYKRLLARLNNWSVEKSFTYKNKIE